MDTIIVVDLYLADS